MELTCRTVAVHSKFDYKFWRLLLRISQKESWHEMGHDDTVHVGPLAKWDEKYLKSSVMTIVQVNGKLRAKRTVE